MIESDNVEVLQVVCFFFVFRRRRRNGSDSGVVPGDPRREMVRDEPRADRHHHILPGHDEKVPKGNVVQTMVAHFSKESLPIGQFLLAEVKSASDEATKRA